MSELFIHGGTVVDGTGAPPLQADVRVRDGRIVEVAPGLEVGDEPSLDATGMLVTPGLIETHTHVDGAMWWDPDLDPLPGYGATTVVYGNCGVSVAPLGPASRDEIVDLFCFLEDLPVEAFREHVPWTWTTWPEYVEAVAGQATALNVAGYVGHISLRAHVMGDAAWDRPATADERARMADLLDASLAAGALGLSTNRFDRDHQLRPVPTRLADEAEYAALFDVLARHRGATFQVITRFNEPEHLDADVEFFADLARPRGVRGQWTAIPPNVDEAEYRAQALALHERLLASGTDFWANVPHKALDLYFNFERSLTFQRVPAWHELVNGPPEDKLRLLADPAWRDRARSDWRDREPSRRARVDRPHTLMLALSETGAGPTGISLADYADELGVHVSDALATWLCANGIGSSLRALPEEHAEDELAELYRSPNTLTNINDSGAHLQLFCGAGQAIHLLTHHARDTGRLTVPEAVHCLTGRLADFFGFDDRGRVAPDTVADLAVFDLDRLAIADEVKAHDVPGGSWRFTRPPGGFAATIVAGVPTHLDGTETGARPGRPVAPTS